MLDGQVVLVDKGFQTLFSSLKIGTKFSTIHISERSFFHDASWDGVPVEMVAGQCKKAACDRRQTSFELPRMLGDVKKRLDSD